MPERLVVNLSGEIESQYSQLAGSSLIRKKSETLRKFHTPASESISHTIQPSGVKGHSITG
jgi:hypothetical protein